MSALDLASDFYVNWRRGEESLPVFTYNPNTGEFTPTDFAAGRVEIETATVDEISWVAFLIDGEYAAFFNDVGEFSVSTLSDVRPSPSIPYLEFVSRRDTVPDRAVTLTKEGRLGFSNAEQVISMIDGTGHFLFTAGASAEPDGRILASRFKEIELWTDESGDYLTDDAGNMIELGNISIP